jgi:hypothetical protein
LEATTVLPQTSSEAILKPQTAGQILVAAKGLHWDCCMEKETKKGKSMGILWLVLFVVVWVALQAYILPKFGIST